MDQKTDAEIVARILEGDVQAYAQLVDAYKSPIYNLAFRMTGSLSDAEDLTQEIFIRAYQKLYQFNRGKKYFTWLYTIGINLIRNHSKKKSKDALTHTMDHFSTESQRTGKESREGDFLSEDSIKRLDENMQKLPVDMREAIILKYYQDMTFEEVAAVTSDSVSAVKMRVYRGLEKLKALMDK